MSLYYGVFDNSLALRSVEIVSVASRGIGHFIELKKTVTNKLGEPYNICDDNTKDLETPLVKEIASRGSEYSQEACYNLCKLHFMEKSCNCSLPYHLRFGGNDTCDSSCVKHIQDTFDYNYNCKSECPLECDSVSFDLVKETKKIVDPYFIDIIKDNLNKSEKFSNYTLDSIKENLIFLSTNFGKMSFSQLTEIPKKTFTDLISDLGGIIGNIKNSILFY